MSLLQKMELGNERYPALTGVRAVGATVIFFDHFPIWPDAHLTLNVMAFFYVLSGFLIVRVYYQQVQWRSAWLVRYFANRFARIYPVYFLLLTVAVCLRHDFHLGMLLKNYTLTHALFYGTTMIIEPSWSLTVEECFYVLAPLFMLLARRYSFWAAFALGWVLLAAALFVSTLGMSFLGTPRFVMSVTFFGHFVEFFAGVYLALAVMRAEKTDRFAVPGRARTLAGLAGVVLLVIAMLVVYRHEPLNRNAIILINNFLIPAPIALLYWGLLRERTWASRFLSTKILGLLGRSSYSFYLLHTLVIYYLAVPFLLPVIGSRFGCVLLACVATWGLSILLFACYEEPVNLAIRRRFRSNEGWVGMRATLFPAAAEKGMGSRASDAAPR